MGFFLLAPKTQIFSYIMRIRDHSNWVGSSKSQDLTTCQSGTDLLSQVLVFVQEGCEGIGGGSIL